MFYSGVGNLKLFKPSRCINASFHPLKTDLIYLRLEVLKRQFS